VVQYDIEVPQRMLRLLSMYTILKPIANEPVDPSGPAYCE
jgi:hypothetical protein